MIFCLTAIPEASIEALRAQLATAHGTASFFPVGLLFLYCMSATLLTSLFRIPEEKDRLIQQHQEELSAQRATSKELKDQLIQLGLDHHKALKAAEADAATKLHEALEDAGNSNAVLQAELEELAKARKAAEDKAARLEAERKQHDLLVTQTDALAFRKLLPFSFRFLFTSLFLPVAFS
jgi:DNA repair exonuclease SbcCD ATPase subunit